MSKSFFNLFRAVALLRENKVFCGGTLLRKDRVLTGNAEKKCLELKFYAKTVNFLSKTKFANDIETQN